MIDNGFVDEGRQTMGNGRRAIDSGSPGNDDESIGCMIQGHRRCSLVHKKSQVICRHKCIVMMGTHPSRTTSGLRTMTNQQ